MQTVKTEFGRNWRLGCFFSQLMQSLGPWQPSQLKLLKRGKMNRLNVSEDNSIESSEVRIRISFMVVGIKDINLLNI